MGASGFVHVKVEKIKRESDSGKAFLVRLEDHDEDIWIPKSQMADPGDYKVGDGSFELAITEWIAREKGIMPD